MFFSCVVLKSMQPFSICRNRDPNISFIFIGYLVSNKKKRNVHLRIGNTFPVFYFFIYILHIKWIMAFSFQHPDRNIWRFLTFHIVIRLKRNFSNGLISRSIDCVNVYISCGMVKWLCFNFDFERPEIYRFHNDIYMIGIRKIKISVVILWKWFISMCWPQFLEMSWLLSQMIFDFCW